MRHRTIQDVVGGRSPRSAEGTQTGSDQASAEENKAKGLRVYSEVINGKNPEAFRDLVTPDVVGHLPQYPEPIRGMEALIDWMHNVYHAAWDSQVTVERIVAEGDDVVIFWTKRATHVGEYIGIPGTGREVTLEGVEWLRFENGRCCEFWLMIDPLSMMQQVGVFPKGPPPRALLKLIIGLQRIFHRRQKPSPGDAPARRAGDPSWLSSRAAG